MIVGKDWLSRRQFGKPPGCPARFALRALYQKLYITIIVFCKIVTHRVQVFGMFKSKYCLGYVDPILLH